MLFRNLKVNVLLQSMWKRGRARSQRESIGGEALICAHSAVIVVLHTFEAYEAQLGPEALPIVPPYP